MRSKAVIKIINNLDYLCGFSKKDSSEINIKLDYNQTAEEYLKRLKKIFNVSDEEYEKYLKKYEQFLAIHIMEKNNYKKKCVNKHIAKIIPKTDTIVFVNSIRLLLEKVENEQKNDPKNSLSKRLCINMFLGLGFEYACKVALLNNDFSINEPKKIKIRKSFFRKLIDVLCSKQKENKKLKTDLLLELNKENEEKLNKHRTISLGVAWDFIKTENLIKLNDKEILFGNYMCCIRNLISHTPYLLAEKGNYVDECILLIKKIFN